RNYLVNAPHAEPVALAGKRIIVTGPSPRSLGFETARILASWGAHVVVTTRTNTDATIAALRATLDVTRRDNIAGHALDLCDRVSVQDFAQWYHQHANGILDVLINNAGIHLDLLAQWKQPKLTADGFELHWRTNYLGTAHLTQLLLPCLIAAGAQ